MKIITLLAGTLVAGVVRYPVEGALTVTDEEAARLHEADLLDGEPEDVPAEDGGDADHDGLDDEKLPELGRIVTKEGVALNGATKKDDIIAAIRAHRANKE